MPDCYPERSKKSCDLPVVVLQETAQSLLAAYFAITGTHPLFSCWKKQNIFLSLMVSLSMVVLHECRQRPPQGRLAEQNQPRQAFLFYRSHPSLRVCVQIRTPCRQCRIWRSSGHLGMAVRWSEPDLHGLSSLLLALATDYFETGESSKALRHKTAHRS